MLMRRNKLVHEVPRDQKATQVIRVLPVPLVIRVNLVEMESTE